MFSDVTTVLHPEPYALILSIFLFNVASLVLQQTTATKIQKAFARLGSAQCRRDWLVSLTALLGFVFTTTVISSVYFSLLLDSLALVALANYLLATKSTSPSHTFSNYYNPSIYQSHNEVLHISSFGFGHIQRCFGIRPSKPTLRPTSCCDVHVR